jgi:hypothetical protein
MNKHYFIILVYLMYLSYTRRTADG